jgi:hypothetical protein
VSRARSENGVYCIRIKSVTLQDTLLGQGRTAKATTLNLYLKEIGFEYPSGQWLV